MLEALPSQPGQNGLANFESGLRAVNNDAVSCSGRSAFQ